MIRLLCEIFWVLFFTVVIVVLIPLFFIGSVGYILDFVLPVKAPDSVGGKNFSKLLDRF